MEDFQTSQQQIEKWTSYRDKMQEGSGAWNIYQKKIDAAQNRQTDAMEEVKQGLAFGIYDLDQSPKYIFFAVDIFTSPFKFPPANGK